MSAVLPHGCVAVGGVVVDAVVGGVGLVVGGGYLYVPEFNWHHYEFLLGLERNFKFSKRRLRIGIYGVLSDGNQIGPTPSWKVSFAILDRRSMKWNF